MIASKDTVFQKFKDLKGTMQYLKTSIDNNQAINEKIQL